MHTDSDRLLGPGVKLTLTDGRQVRLRYGMRSLKLIEDEFGSLPAVEEATKDGNGKAIGPLMSLLAAGLVHEGLTADALLDLTSPADIPVYSRAIEVAFGQAMPANDDGDVAGPSPNGETPTGVSPGSTSTGSPPSGSDEPTTSSGT